jgi:dihydroxy-acid dehydratase
MSDKIIPITPASPSNRRSANITQGKSRAPNRSMYYAMGYEEGDFVKPMVGVANGHSTITPCNSGLQKLADAAVAGIEEAGGNAQIFGTPTISDGMAMGTEGMKYSLISREVISDCIETCVQGQWMDGVLVVGGCDKNMPGGMMGILRANVPAIYVYGGTILPGRYQGKDLNIVSVFEAVGQNAAGNLSDFDLKEIEKRAIPGTGSCGGMYTANTMSSAFEALGMSLPYSSTMANPHDETKNSAKESAKVLLEAIKKDLKPRDIVTKEAIENAVAVIMATGGSTNAVLHFLAIAHTAGVEWTIDDFERMRKKIPVICDLKPSGQYLAVDLHRAGGIPQVMKVLLKAGLLHGDCMTITGKTVAENLKDIPDAPRADQDVIRTIDNPMYASLPALPACLTTSNRRCKPFWTARSKLATSWFCDTLAPRAVLACPKCWPLPVRSLALAWAKASVSLPMAVSLAAHGAWWWVMWPQKQLRVAPLPWCMKVTPSPSMRTNSFWN